MYIKVKTQLLNMKQQLEQTGEAVANHNNNEKEA